MNKILIILLMIFSINMYADKIDINNTDISAIDTLMIPDEVIDNIKAYIRYKGEIKSIYELTHIEGVDSEIFDILKKSLAIYPDTTIDEISVWLLRLQERLASEESPTQGAIDLWEEMLIHKMNINKATLNDLLQINNINITDAVAIIKARDKLGDFSWDGQVRRSVGLTYYAWTNLRNYITFEDNKDWEFSGYLRTYMRYSNDDTYNYSSYTAMKYQLLNAINDLKVSAPDSTNTRDILIEAGVDESDIEFIKQRLNSEYNQLNLLEQDGDFINKLKLRFGKYLAAGGLFTKYSGLEYYNFKGYINARKFAGIDNLILGNFRISIGQGLVLDNTDEYRARKYNVINGLFGDITENYGSNFTGLAISGKALFMDYLIFESMNYRNAILNPDGTVNTLLMSNTFIEEFKQSVYEKTRGGRIAFNLGKFNLLPLSTQIGFTGFRSYYNRAIKKDTLFIDIPFDKDRLNDPVYLQGFEGDIRTVLGVDFRTDFKNMSIQGEIAKQDNAYAYVMRHDIVYNNFYFRTILRHIDVGYDNPFARFMSEQSRFDDTVLEKEYRLIDPLYVFLTDDARSKPEQGIYFETRFRISEKLTITRAYIDIWRTMNYYLNNYRFQGEIEYRPVFPLRIRLKQKIQQKYIHKNIVATKSLTNETTLRVFAILSNSDYINFEARYGRVNLTTSRLYAENYIIDGTYVNVSFEHKINDYFSVLSGIATWKTDGMSQWIFEDTGIDFLYGDGQKVYITVIDRISDNISIRLKTSIKNQDINFYGLYQPDSEYKYFDGEYMPIHDFADYNNIFNLNLRLDFRW